MCKGFVSSLPTTTLQMDQSFSMQKDWGAMGEGESDEVKR